jgi:hypothetical protein
MPESMRTRLTRWVFNFFPAYRGSRAWVSYIASDWREVRVCLPLSWQTRNYVGAIFGGSMYAAVDPFYMIMLMHNLGPEWGLLRRGKTLNSRGSMVFMWVLVVFGSVGGLCGLA